MKLPKLNPTSMKNSPPSPSSSPFKNTSERTVKSRDSGYSKLAILPSGPNNPLPIDKDVPKEDGEIDDYASPVDAVKFNPLINKFYLDRAAYSPSPPSSPVTPDVPPRKSSRSNSHYQSVDEIRRMREMQLREKDKQRPNISRHLGQFQYDENPGYSKPFDALPAGGTRLPPADSKKSPPALPGGDGRGLIEKLAKESCARILHQVEPTLTSSGRFPSSSRPSQMLGTNSSPDIRTIGLELPPTNHEQNSIPESISKSEGTTVDDPLQENEVNRFILKVEDRQAERELTRAETGRTSSVDSTHKFYTPTRLRNGLGHVITSKSKARKPKEQGGS